MKIKNIFKSIGIIFLLITFSSFFFILFNIDIKNISDKNYLIYYTLSNLILFIIFIIIYHKTLIKDFKEYKNNFKKNILFSFKYWFVGFIIMYISNLIITKVLYMNIPGNEENVRNYITISPILMILNTCLFAPFTEELTFRKSIKEAINNKWLYIITSGLLFALLHIISYIKSPIHLIYLIPYGALGICFSFLYYKTDNIYNIILMHALHNTIAILIFLLGVPL